LPVLALAVTDARLTLAPVMVFVSVTKTVEPAVAVPVIAGNSDALMTLSVAMLAAMAIGVGGAKLAPSMVTTVALLCDEL
jgi:hypothetical protein